MKSALLPLVALLAACATTPDPTPAPPRAENYRAIGTEPGWAVTITSTQIEHLGDYGKTRIVTPRPEPRITFNGRRYEARQGAHSLVVDITHAKCNDGMSDRIFADTVMLIVDGRTLKGCGGAIVPPTTLADTNWTIVSIGGTPVTGDRPATLSFTKDRLSGSSGCNRFSADYAQQEGRLRLGRVASTRMACPEPAMVQENRLFAILADEITVNFRDGDTLVLGSRDGEVVLKRLV